MILCDATQPVRPYRVSTSEWIESVLRGVWGVRSNNYRSTLLMMQLALSVFDAAQGDYGDLVERGIIDPVKVVRIALENACSIAGAMITGQVAIADAVLEDNEAEAA